MLFQDPTQVTARALERWPELVLAFAVALIFGVVIVKLYNKQNATRDDFDKRRDEDMKRVITAHEQSSALIAVAIRTTSESILAAVKEIRDERRRSGTR